MRAYLISASLLILLISCNKDHNPIIDGAGVRLEKIDAYESGVITSTIELKYDGQGRIAKIDFTEPGSPYTRGFTVSYPAGSEAIIEQDVISNAGFTGKANIHLWLDAERKPLKRISYSETEWKAPSNIPQRSFIFDTTTFSYDAAGFPATEEHSNFDTTWYDPGVPTITLNRIAETRQFTIQGSNLQKLSINSILTSATTQEATTASAYRNTKTDVNFAYTKAYPNNGDFYNAAVLQEVLFLGFVQANSHFANYPDEISTVSTDTDQNGFVLSTDHSVMKPTAEFNSLNFITTLTNDPAQPGNKLVYTYNK